MRVYVESYGCSQNQGEGAAIARALAEEGHEIVPEPRDAEAGILVSCGVIASTEARMVRRWQALAERLPRVLVTGCLVPLRTDLLDGPGRDRTLFVPIREQARIPALLLPPPGEVPAPSGRSPGGLAMVPLAAHPPVTEEVVIAQGCTSGCSYCYSRLARGPLESVPIPEVVRRVRSAVARGVHEVRLTSLDTAAWGLDRTDGARLPDLLRAVAQVPGEFRIRVGMMSPQTLRSILDDHLEVLASDRCYHFLHLPAQSGSDRVLHSMRRGYTAAEFERQVAEARGRIPDLALSTDVIVGFPGETDDDHRATEALLESVAPEMVNVTRFSARPGTPAARLPRLPPSVAKGRSRALTTLRQRLARARFERWIGRELPARVLEHGAGSSSVARFPNYLPVVLGERQALGRMLTVRVDGARATYLLGRPA